MAKQIQGGWRTNSQGQRSCRVDRFEYWSTGVNNPQCTVELWEGLCHPCSPSLQPVKGAQGERSMCALYLLIKESNTLQHARRSSGYSRVIHLSLYFFFLSNGIWRHCGLHWEHLSLSLVHMVEQRKGACREGDNWYNPALKTHETELGWHLMVQVQVWGRLHYCSCWFVDRQLHFTWQSL